MSINESRLLYRRIVKSYFSSVVSISLVLFLVGIAGVLMANAHAIAAYFRENVMLSVILNLEVQEDRAAETADTLASLHYVKGVEIISRERGAEEMREMLGDDFLKVFASNPIPISIEVSILSPYVSSDSLNVIKKEIEKMPQVKEAAYHESMIDLLNANIEKIGMILGIFIILLMFISFVLISNTVRLNVYSKRFTIRTMRLVGATKGFITKPFLGQAFFQGLISGFIAVLAILGIVYAIRNEFHQLYTLFDPVILGGVMLVVIGVGVFICMTSTMFTVRKLISLKNDELYY